MVGSSYGSLWKLTERHHVLANGGLGAVIGSWLALIGEMFN